MVLYQAELLSVYAKRAVIATVLRPGKHAARGPEVAAFGISRYGPGPAPHHYAGAYWGVAKW